MTDNREALRAVLDSWEGDHIVTQQAGDDLLDHLLAHGVTVDGAEHIAYVPLSGRQHGKTLALIQALTDSGITVVQVEVEPQPHVVTTVEGLEALPDKTLIQDRPGDLYFRNADEGAWEHGGQDGTQYHSAFVALPATVLTTATQPTASDVEYVRNGVCLVCGGGVLDSGEHLDPERHAQWVANLNQPTASEYPPVPASLAAEFASGADATAEWHRYCDDKGLRRQPAASEPTEAEVEAAGNALDMTQVRGEGVLAQARAALRAARRVAS